MKCSYCGSDDHPWFNCRKKPEGWKPSKQLAGPLTGVEVGRSALQPAMLEVATRPFKSTSSPTASRARPEQSGLGHGIEAHALVVAGGGESGMLDSPAAIPKPRGRPRTGFDKKAYDRQKAAEARAKLKAKRNG